MKNIFRLSDSTFPQLLSEISMQLKRILTKLCQSKPGAPVHMPHCVYESSSSRSSLHLILTLHMTAAIWRRNTMDWTTAAHIVL